MYVDEVELKVLMFEFEDGVISDGDFEGGVIGDKVFNVSVS